MRQHLELLLPAEALRQGAKADTLEPAVEDRPGHEQGGQKNTGQQSGEEQAADGCLGGNAVDDHGDARRDQDAERAAGGDGTGGDFIGIAALGHLGDAHLADGRAGRRRRTGERREDGTGAEIGENEPAGHAVEPAVQPFVQIPAGRRRGYGAAHQDEHRDRDKGKARKPAEERFADDVDAEPAFGEDQGGDGYETECERDGHADGEKG